MGIKNMGALALAIPAISQIFSGFFGLKGKQSDVVSSALNSFNAVSETDKAYFSASAAAIDAVYTNGSWVERMWRPALMWVCVGMIVSRWFGHVPPGLTPEEVNNVYTFVYIGLGGYMPLRSLDKWMQGFQIGSVLKSLITKSI